VSSNSAVMMRWLMVAALLFVSGWFLNIATYNWFAADSRGDYSHSYALRGNIFFVAALVLFAASVWVTVATLRSRKKRRMAKT